MLRSPFARQALLAALLSGCAAGAFATEEGPSPEPVSVAAAPASEPSRAKRPAVPPLTPEQLAENAALAAGAEDEPAHVTLAEVTPRERRVAPLTAEEFAPGAQTSLDLQLLVPSTLEAAASVGISARPPWDAIPEVTVASDDFLPPIAFDERGDATRRGYAFARVAAPETRDVASAPAPATVETVAEAMAALVTPVPEAEPSADGAPLALALADETVDARETGLSVLPRRRPQAPATAEGGPEVPVVFELRRK